MKAAMFFILMIGLLFSSLYAEHREFPTQLGDQIFQRLELENQKRAEKLKCYTSSRRYAVHEKGKPSDAEIKVQMDYVSPSTKKFQVLSQAGAGWIDRWVFRSLIRAEEASASGKDKAASTICAKNYEVKFLGSALYQNRDCFLLELHPRRIDRRLIDGRMWVDKSDFAIVKLEGEPAKNLSFWVTRAHLVREYQKIGEFWLQLRDETHAEIRMVGEYIMEIEYSAYTINGQNQSEPKIDNQTSQLRVSGPP